MGTFCERKNMKKSKRKRISVYRRDLWDGSKIFDFYSLDVDTIKHKLKHLPKKDRRTRETLKDVLCWKTGKMFRRAVCSNCGAIRVQPEGEPFLCLVCGCKDYFFFAEYIRSVE